MPARELRRRRADDAIAEGAAVVSSLAVRTEENAMSPRVRTLTLVAAIGLGLPAALPCQPMPRVRAAYLVPSNRMAQPSAVAIVRQLMLAWQSWLCDRTERADAVPRELRIETEADGVTPRVHVVPLAVTDATIRLDVWNQSINAAAAAGVTVWAQRGRAATNETRRRPLGGSAASGKP